jgi:hypothetical protein
MRSALLSFFATATIVAASTLSAHADTVDQFTFTFNGMPLVVFSLPQPLSPTGTTADGSIIFNAPVVFSSEATTDPVETFYSNQGMGGLEVVFMANNTEYGAIAHGPQLFAGADNAPTFSPGTVNLEDGSFAVFGTSYPTTDNSITISQTTSPVPEPSDIMLFGTGFLSLAGLAYRRFQRALRTS